MEVHGLCDPQDFKYLTEHIIPKSRKNEASAVQEWKEYQWQRVGLSKQQIEREFPWSSGGLSALPSKGGWYRGGTRPILTKGASRRLPILCSHTCGTGKF